MNDSGSEVLGSEWFEKFAFCRKSPKEFIDYQKVSIDAFCLDVLKDLCSDRVDNQCKVHMLLLLQEHSYFFIHDADMVEQVIGSLLSLYHTFENCEDKKLLKSQIFITVTTVLLSQEVLDDSLCSLLKDIKTLLLDVALTPSKDHVLVSTACRCLEEIEIFFPEILKTDIENIWHTCQNYSLPAFQCYAVLLSLCLKHSTENELRVSENNREHLLIKELSVEKEHSNNEIQTLPLVTYLLDLLPLMTVTSVYMVFKNLIYIVKNTPELLPVTFKTWVMRLMFSSDIQHFHLAFDLLKTFGIELFTTQEEQTLIRQLIICTIHPSLRIPHRLLCLDWLGFCINKKNIFSCNLLTSCIPTLVPGPFDCIESQEKKLQLLSQCVIPSEKSSKASELLMNSLTGLKRSALLRSGIKPTAALFRTLFCYFSLHQNTIIKSDIFRLVLDVIITSPYLTPNVVDFLNCIKLNYGKSSLPEEILTKLVEHIIDLPVNQLANDLPHFLSILEVAAVEESDVCKPQALLRYLQKLVKSKVTDKDDWFIGHNILSVCQSFLKHQNVQILYYDLGEILYLVMKNFNDIDVKIRAKVYYASLTSLSASKIQQMFEGQFSTNDTTNTITSLVSGRESVFHYRNIIQKLSKPVLELHRIEGKDNNITTEVLQEKLNEDNKNILTVYKEWISSSSFQPVVKVPFMLKHCEDAKETFSTLFSVVISVQASPANHIISDITVPVLTRHENGIEHQGKVVNVEIAPTYIHPVTLQFRAEFTCISGHSFICDLSPVELQFEDLFLPLPIPHSVAVTRLSWKQQLFDELWLSFKTEVNEGVHSSSCCESVYCLELPITTLSQLSEFVMKHWKFFIVSEPLQSAPYCIAFFFPQSSHLLMKVSILNDAPFVCLLTDNWVILPWLEIYFKRLN